MDSTGAIAVHKKYFSGAEERGQAHLPDFEPIRVEW
jgi:hypothetical protein